MRSKYYIKFIFFVFVFLCISDVSLASEKLNGYNRIYYYREGIEARNKLYNYPSSIDVLAPQSYSLDKDGNLKGSINDEVLAFTKKKKIKIMPLVTNIGFSRSAGEEFLDSESAQDDALGAMVDEAKKMGYVGWQIDFEQISSLYEDRFSAFVKKFGQKMKENDLVSSVAVIAKISDNPRDYKTGLWEKIIGVFDYDVISENTDFVSVMSYDDPDSRGPIARFSWFKDVVDYSLEHIPKEKISIGLAFYYWRYDVQTDKRLGIGGYKQMKERINKYKMTRGYSEIEQAPYMKYSYNNSNYIIWYENAKSIKNKLDYVKNKGIYSFSAWALGLEYPDVYDGISAWKKTLTIK